MAVAKLMLGSASTTSTIIKWKPPPLLHHHHHPIRLSSPFKLSHPSLKITNTRSNIIGVTSSSNSRESESSSSSTKLGDASFKPFQARTILKALMKTAIAAVLLGLLLLVRNHPNLALAASSGGRMGGRSFSSSSSSSRRSYTTRIVSSDLASMPYYAPSPFGFSGGGGGFYVGPAVGVGAGSSSLLIFLSFAAFVVVSGFLSDRSDGSVHTDTDKTSVLKLQVGLLGMGRSLQRDLNRIAETADTSTSEGLHYVLTETTLALLRHPSYCISAYSSVDVKKGMEEGEKRFNQLSIEERGKFDEETLVNVNNVKRQSKAEQIASGFSNEYIVITILVAAEGVLKLPAINGSGDMKEALQKFASIPASRTLAIEVLWTPQNENDALSERELLEDYPLLRPL